jgi:hypothetical protein
MALPSVATAAGITGGGNIAGAAACILNRLLTKAFTVRHLYRYDIQLCDICTVKIYSFLRWLVKYLTICKYLSCQVQIIIMYFKGKTTVQKIK